VILGVRAPAGEHEPDDWPEPVCLDREAKQSDLLANIEAALGAVQVGVAS
jgi:hypothetical protein